jgi:hypothetical protein
LPCVLLVVLWLNSAVIRLRKKSLMGKWRTGIALPTELLPRLVEQTGVEPMTDNPMSSAHQK